MTAERFAPGWVTLGWSRINGVWQEIGSIGGVFPYPVPVPEIGVHEISLLLNELLQFQYAFFLRRNERRAARG